MYRIGFLGWKLAARCGVPLLIKIDVVKDDATGVLIATSNDLAGLVTESRSMDTLMRDVYDCVDMLLEAQLKQAPRQRPLAAWSGDICAA
jgi:Domain of unknown function (DUF1902)